MLKSWKTNGFSNRILPLLLGHFIHKTPAKSVWGWLCFTLREFGGLILTQQLPSTLQNWCKAENYVTQLFYGSETDICNCAVAILKYHINLQYFLRSLKVT